MGEIPVHQPTEVQLAWTRREFIRAGVLGFLALANVGLYGAAYELITHYDQYFPGSQPEGDVEPPPSTVASTSADATPAVRPTAIATPKKELFVPQKNHFLIGPFNFEGIRSEPLRGPTPKAAKKLMPAPTPTPEIAKLLPAPPVFLFLNTPEGKTLSAWVHPKALEDSDDRSKLFDWRNPINGSFLNVTGRKNGHEEGFVVQVGHSGVVPFFWTGPWEGFRKYLEANGRRFTPKEFKSTVDMLTKSDGTILQGDLAPGKRESDVTASGEGLINPTIDKAKINWVLRLAPEDTLRWEKDSFDAYNNPDPFTKVNVLDYFTPPNPESKHIQPVSINPLTDVIFEFCGWETFMGESRPFGVALQQTSRYFFGVNILM